MSPENPVGRRNLGFSDRDWIPSSACTRPPFFSSFQHSATASVGAQPSPRVLGRPSRSPRSAGSITVTHGWRPDPNLSCWNESQRPLGVHRLVAFRALNRPAPSAKTASAQWARLLTFDLALGGRLERADGARTCVRWGFQERQETERRRGHYEEVDGCEAAHMVLEKCPPGLRGRLGRWCHGEWQGGERLSLACRRSYPAFSGKAKVPAAYEVFRRDSIFDAACARTPTITTGTARTCLWPRMRR